MPKALKALEEAKTNEERLIPVLSAQHPIDGMIAEVFMEMGGKDYLKEWAIENPGKFLMLMMRQKPQSMPIVSQPGEIVIKIESSLSRTSLDDNNIIDVN